MSKKHHGSSLDNLLEEDGVFEETQALAIKEVVVWQLIEAMEKQSLSKARLAVMLETSRSQVDRLLDPTRDVTLSGLQRAAALVGRKFQIELVESGFVHSRLFDHDQRRPFQAGRLAPVLQPLPGNHGPALRRRDNDRLRAAHRRQPDRDTTRPGDGAESQFASRPR